MSVRGTSRRDFDPDFQQAPASCETREGRDTLAQMAAKGYTELLNAKHPGNSVDFGKRESRFIDVRFR
jgi:hypothetical protein